MQSVSCKIVYNVLVKCDLKLVKDIFEVPSEVKVISETAFTNAQNIKKVVISDSVIKINEKAFDGFRKLEEFYVSSDHPVYTVKDGIIFSKDMSEIIFVPANFKKKTYYVPDNVVKIGTSFAKCAGVENLILGKGISVLDKYAISEWKYDIKRIISIPKNVVQIHDDAFSFNLNVIAIRGEKNSVAESFAKKNNIPFFSMEEEISIQEDVLKTIIAEENDLSDDVFLTFFNTASGSMGVAFSEIYNTKCKRKISVPDCVNEQNVEIFDFEKEYIPDVVEELFLPKSINEIVFSKFNFAKGLKKLVIDSENEYYWSDGKGVYTKDKKIFLRLCDFNTSAYTVKEGTLEIASYAFADCIKLEKIILPDTIHTVNDNAFTTGYVNCENLREIVNIELVTNMRPNALHGVQYLLEQNEVIIGTTLVKYSGINEKTYIIPDGITTICDGAFYVNSEEDILETIIFSNSVKTLGEAVFQGRKKLKHIRMSNALTNIPNYTFFECNSLSSIYIPKSVTSISINSFPRGNGFKEIIVDKDNENFVSIAGMLYSKDTKNLICCPEGIDISAVNILDTTEKIKEYAFCCCNNLKKINLANVKIIEKGAFYNCSSLVDIIMSPKLEVIGEFAFQGTSLNKIELLEGLKEIKACAFAECNFSRVIVPKTVEVIEHEAFSGCDEIIIYNTIEPNGNDCYSKIDKINGFPNSQIGFIGIGHSHTLWKCAGNHIWRNYTITVKDAKTEDILYKVLMESNASQRQYYCLLTSGWGKNGTFAFKEVDKYFRRIKGMIYKIRVALTRLRYKVDLDEKFEQEYISYIKKNGKTAIKHCMGINSIDLMEICVHCGAANKNNIDELIEYANKYDRTEMMVVLKKYKNEYL